MAGTLWERGPQKGSLNEVRSWRPEQCGMLWGIGDAEDLVSMKSGLRDRNNKNSGPYQLQDSEVSMKSGLGDRNNLSTAPPLAAKVCVSQ